MIDYFQENKSTRATCRRCREFITDKMRGVEETIGFGGHKEHHYFCLNCSGEVIKQTKKELQRMEQTLKVQVRKLETKV